MYTKDQILLITTGEYSDYFPLGVFKVLKDFDIEEVKKVAPLDKNKTWNHPDQMLSYLISSDYILNIDAEELHFDRRL